MFRYKITKFYAIYFCVGRGHSSANVCAQSTETYVDMPVGFQVIALFRETILNSRCKILGTDKSEDRPLGCKWRSKGPWEKNLSRTASTINRKKNEKVNIEQATKAQRGSRGIAILFL